MPTILSFQIRFMLSVVWSSFPVDVVDTFEFCRSMNTNYNRWRSSSSLSSILTSWFCTKQNYYLHERHSIAKCALRSKNWVGVWKRGNYSLDHARVQSRFSARMLLFSSFMLEIKSANDIMISEMWARFFSLSKGNQIREFMPFWLLLLFDVPCNLWRILRLNAKSRYFRLYNDQTLAVSFLSRSISIWSVANFFRSSAKSLINSLTRFPWVVFWRSSRSRNSVTCEQEDMSKQRKHSANSNYCHTDSNSKCQESLRINFEQDYINLLRTNSKTGTKKRWLSTRQAVMTWTIE